MISKPVIFISHITEEKDISIALKNFIEKKFLKTVDVFVSSHEESIKLGDDWMGNIKKSMKDCSLTILICSPISITRPWLNFEAGAGWVKDIPVIPFCHSGIIPSKLPVPINSFQGGLLNSKADLSKLFGRIAEITHITAPDIDDEDFFNSLNTIENQIKNGLIVKDTKFIKNLLLRQVSLLKYCIYASTTDLGKISSIDTDNLDLSNYNFKFSDIYNLFNTSLLMIFTGKKIYQLYNQIIHEIIENIKFLLLYQEINIAPNIRNLLNQMLFSLPLTDDWFNMLSMIDLNHNSSIKETLVNLIKEHSSVPSLTPGNIIIHAIFYYNSLIFYKNWITNYENEINAILVDSEN
ncbi:hypothetical protein ASG01_04110 [Chryseobacterium sp. Leaf180]|uniref:toll/interleukin-1 receptor domain-containing protein n=1 Tax=Chryseobacterium sp. Leaf180 TaxID=1736289 RepID=UPI0006F3131B|nr:toll/interleukin-1 receptor domain-containing protein [Chryseobacterium sp. Leaf180]KQR95047.1 hypothetical protein ASG01_04110 [Chryseobacterium sp. Leaf180]